MSHQNEVRVREAFAALARGDLDTLRNDFFSPDLRYHLPGRNQLSGDYDGVDRVMGLFGRIFELTAGTFGFELHAVAANDDHAFAHLTESAERNGRRLNDRTVVAAHLVGGKATEAWFYHTDQYAVDEFWS
ncbi:MAG TPA: nuclear transport factor 2 family protein [Streptosporangiaceae bacterium]|nr:nuclear transport factor 2 family protein [Streptosporangiaceae bacterium]